MNDVPDWLWQGIATNLIADSLVAAGWLAWKYRHILLDKLAQQPVLISAAGGSIGDSAVTLTAGADADLRWKVEAPTPSLARRLEELASWYLHVS